MNISAKVMTNVSTVSRIFLGLFFCISAILKLISTDDFELYVFSIAMTSFDLSSIAARAVIIGEFILGLGLVSGWWHTLVNIAAAVILAAFSAFLVWRMVIGDNQSCHCFGNVAEMNPAQSLVKNIVAALLLALTWLHPTELFSGEYHQDSKPGKMRFTAWVNSHRKTIAFVLSAATAVTVLSVTPPDCWFRWTEKERTEIDTEKFRHYSDSLGLDSGRKIICFWSVNCEHCRHCAAKMAGIIRRNEIPTEMVHCLFMEEYVETDKAVKYFFDKFGAGLELPFSSIHPAEFIPLTNGAMPLVALFEDGTLLKEYDLLTIDESAITNFAHLK